MTKNLLALIVAGGLALGCGVSMASAQDTKHTGGTPAAQPGKEGKKDKEMKTDGAKVGEKAPAFSLTDTDGKTVTLADFTKEKKIVVIEWFNPECPYVKKHYENGASTMTDTAKAFKDKNVVWVRIATNISKDDLAAAKKNWKLDGHILQDTDGKVAGAYGSKNTPTMFIINADGVLAYRGAIDDDNTPEKPGKTNYVKNALEQIVKGETVTTPETKAYGCRVKGPKA
ncbi:MAG: redoxin domain-containing protein [Phycisphaerales bacterium]